MPPPPLAIAICGYGTAAQAAALLLRDQGHAISIFERSAVLAPVGAGFLLQPTGLAVLPTPWVWLNRRLRAGHASTACMGKTCTVGKS